MRRGVSWKVGFPFSSGVIQYTCLNIQVFVIFFHFFSFHALNLSVCATSSTSRMNYPIFTIFLIRQSLCKRFLCISCSEWYIERGAEGKNCIKQPPCITIIPRMYWMQGVFVMTKPKINCIEEGCDQSKTGGVEMPKHSTLVTENERIIWNLKIPSVKPCLWENGLGFLPLE